MYVGDLDSTYSGYGIDFNNTDIYSEIEWSDFFASETEGNSPEASKTNVNHSNITEIFTKCHSSPSECSEGNQEKLEEPSIVNEINLHNAGQFPNKEITPLDNFSSILNPLSNFSFGGISAPIQKRGKSQTGRKFQWTQVELKKLEASYKEAPSKATDEKAYEQYVDAVAKKMLELGADRSKRKCHRWTSAEKEQLLQLYNDGKSLKEINKHFSHLPLSDSQIVNKYHDLTTRSRRP